MHLPRQADSVARERWVYAAAGGVIPSQHCQCERRGRGNRTSWVVDERNSACGANDIATCDQITGGCVCAPIAPVVRLRHYD